MDLSIVDDTSGAANRVEQALFNHPQLMEGAVAGIQDANRGVCVKAHCVLQPG